MFHPEPDILKGFHLLDYIERFQYTENDKGIIIDIIKVKDSCRGTGIGRECLRFLKDRGINVRVKLSTKEAYLFWVKMFDEGFIQNCPDKSMERRI